MSSKSARGSSVGKSARIFIYVSIYEVKAVNDMEFPKHKNLTKIFDALKWMK